MYNRFLKDEKGFTGLEAAIVLIAFVVVAAVFSYVMLGAGFFTTQKSQEVVHTGVTQASSSIAPAGDVIVRGAITADYQTGYGGTGSVKADQITLYITNTAGGTPVDLDKTIITYTDDENFVTVPHVSGTIGAVGAVAVASIPSTVVGWALTTGWVYSGIIISDGDPNGDNLLSSGEKYKLVINVPEVLSFAGAPAVPGIIDPTGANLPQANEKFTIQIKPPEGAVLSITKTLPAALVTNQYYPVY